MDRLIRGDWLLWLLLSVFLGGHFELAADEPKNVLLLNSYRAGFIWTDEQVRGISEGLESHGPFELWAEYMDARRARRARLFDDFETRLKANYSGKTFDLIITTDDDAYDFLLERGEKLFPGVPAVFSGIDEAKAGRAPRERFTGVIEQFNPRKTLSRVATLHPAVMHVYGIVDDSSVGRHFAQEMREAEALFPAASVELINMSQERFDDVLARLKALPGNSLVLFCAVGEGLPFSMYEAVRAVGAAATAPVYTLANSRPAEGILATSASAGRTHARLIVRQAARVLGGERTESIPLLEDDYIELVFDYRELMRWGVRPDRIPPQWRVTNRPVSFYEEYRPLIWLAAGFVLLQTFIIGALVLNVRERRRAEKQLQEALAAANAATEAKSRFLANVSHELRTPLNGIMGVSHLMSGTPLDEEQAEYLSILKGSTERLSHLVDDLLDLTQVEGGRIRISNGALSLRDEVQNLVDLLRPKAVECGLELNSSICGSVPDEVTGDAVRLRQILTNLLSNALKFTPSGKVCLAVRAPAAYPADPKLRFEVMDTGPGISPENLDRIFERFTQVDESATRQAGGAGIGLALCRQLSELMGGQIGVNSQVGKGSTFWVELPLPPVSD